MSFVTKCANCETDFDRGYRISKARALRPQYCSHACFGGAAAKRAAGNLENRFWSRVDRKGVDECWPWMGRLNPGGYGLFDIDGPKLAHRFAYFMEHPEADSARFVCHSCDNPPCCNPRHLWLGTNAENVQDMDDKGRRRSVPRHGEASNKAKLTAKQALEIYQSNEPANVLASRFGISGTAVSLIKRGRNWARVTGVRHAS